METTTLASLGAIAHASQPLMKKGAELLDSLLGEPLKVAGGMLGDQVYAWRVARAATLGANCRAVLDEAGVAPRQLPTGFLLPFIEAAVGSDPALDQMWAKLLASATASDANQHPVFREVLRRITADEAMIIETLYLKGPAPAVLIRNAVINFFWSPPERIGGVRSDLVGLYLANLVNSTDIIDCGEAVDGDSADRVVVEHPLLMPAATAAGLQLPIKPSDLYATRLRLNVLGTKLAEACIRGPTRSGLPTGAGSRPAGGQTPRRS